MRRGPLFALVLLVSTALATLALAEGTPPAADGAEKAVFPIVPRDKRIRVYQCGGAIQGSLQTRFGGSELLGSAGEYVRFELFAQPYANAVANNIACEWLRATDHAVLCARRDEGSVTTVLDPPQPFLELPLEVGKRWTWRGTASGVPCESSSVVVGREKLTLPVGPIEDAWRVDTVIRGAEGDKLERSIWLVAGLGLVQEVTRIESGGRSANVIARLEAITERDDSAPSSKPRRRAP
jgi:hypothetical protein